MSEQKTTGRKGQAMSEDIYRQLGALSEGMENAKEGRKEIVEALKAFSQNVNDMRTEFRGMTATLQSTSAAVASLAADKCGQRLDALETKTRHYDRVLGRANTLAWKIAGMTVASALLSTGFMKLAQHF